MTRVSIGEIKAGDVFEVKGGTITVIQYINRGKIHIKHNDEHSHCMWTRKDAIEKGMVKNPYFRSVQGFGYFGVGKYVTIKDGARTVEYAAWVDMLVRCYSENYLKKYPSYLGCTVCEEWHNFQNFAEWYTREDEYGRGYHLDKDILVKGNKIYSPDTCCLVPQEINKFFTSTGEKKNGLPTGVTATKNNSFKVKASLLGVNKYIGTFKTLEEAVHAYSHAKGVDAKELALRNLGNIRYKVFLAIMNWEF